MKSSEHDLELTRLYLDGEASKEEVRELEKKDDRGPSTQG